MIQEITLTKRVQTPTPPNELCYQDQGEDFRYFTKRVLLGKNEQPWAECTEAARLAYEAEWAATHPEADTTDQPTEVAADAATTPAAEEGAGV